MSESKTLPDTSEPKTLRDILRATTALAVRDLEARAIEQAVTDWSRSIRSRLQQEAQDGATSAFIEMSKDVTHEAARVSYWKTVSALAQKEGLVVVPFVRYDEAHISWFDTTESPLPTPSDSL